MKKLRFLPLFLLVLACLFSTAFAAGISGQQSISYIIDANGYVSSLTDGDASTAWTKSSSDDVDLTIHLYNARVGEIWLRNGYAYTQNWYNHYDRPGTVKVTVHYAANQYTESYDTYRYQLTDAYRPNTSSKDWQNGYQRLLLPKQYKNVTMIELTVENAYAGYGRTGATISDIIVTSGNHATATPKSYTTATPKPYVVYVTATPGPEIEEDDDSLVEYITPIPTDEEEEDDDPLVEYITPRPTATPTVPVVEVITPQPTSTIDYPSEGGAIGYATKQIATRFGPSAGFGEPGSFFQKGREVKVISKVWDATNNLYWYQLEFEYQNEWYRVYTTDSRVDVDSSLLPDEPLLDEPLVTLYTLEEQDVYYGPGEEYKFLETIAENRKCSIYNIENGWAQIEFYSNRFAVKCRGWVPLSALYDE